MKKRLMFVVLAAVLTACGGDSTGPKPITGNYTLRTVNGNSVPAVIMLTASEKDELTSGNFNLNADHTWSGALGVRVTDLTTGDTISVDAPITGTYANNSGSITLTDATDGSHFTGTVGGGTLTINTTGSGGTFALVYKQ